MEILKNKKYIEFDIFKQREDKYYKIIKKILEENKYLKNKLKESNEILSDYINSYSKIDNFLKSFSNNYNQIFKINKMVNKKSKLNIKVESSNTSSDNLDDEDDDSEEEKENEDYSYSNILESLESIDVKKGNYDFENLNIRKTLPENFNESSVKKKRQSHFTNNFGFQTDAHHRDLLYKNDNLLTENKFDKNNDDSKNSLYIDEDFMKFDNNNEELDEHKDSMDENNDLLNKIKINNDKVQNKINKLKNYIYDLDKILEIMLYFLEYITNDVFTLHEINIDNYLEKIAMKIDELKLNNINIFNIFLDKYFDSLKEFLIKFKELPKIFNLNYAKGLLKDILKTNFFQKTIKENIISNINNIDSKSNNIDIDFNYINDKIKNFINKNSNTIISKDEMNIKYNELQEKLGKITGNKEIKKLMDNYDKTTKLLYNTIKMDSNNIIEKSEVNDIDRSLKSEIIKLYNLFKNEVELQLNNIKNSNKLVFYNSNQNKEDIFKYLLKLASYEKNFKVKLFLFTYHSVLKLNYYYNNSNIMQKTESRSNLVNSKLNSIKKIFYEYFNKIPEIDLLDFTNDELDFNEIKKNYSDLIYNINQNLNSNLVNNDNLTQRSTISMMEKNIQKVNPIPILIDVHLLFNRFKLLVCKEINT